LTPDPTVLHRASTTLLRLRPSTLDSPVHYPSTPTSIDNQVLARPECYTGAKTLENLPRGPSGDGGVLEGEEGLKEGDLNKLDGLWGTLKRVGEAAREEGIKVAVDAEHSWYQVGLFCGLDTGS
jgi:proline dehydrogenase